jgi:hypothetical protein
VSSSRQDHRDRHSARLAPPGPAGESECPQGAVTRPPLRFATSTHSLMAFGAPYSDPSSNKDVGEEQGNGDSARATCARPSRSRPRRPKRRGRPSIYRLILIF